jgi:hypothetical protein
VHCPASCCSQLVNVSASYVSPVDSSELEFGYNPPFLVAADPTSPLTTPRGRKIFFITYGSGMFTGAATRLVEQARAMDVFTSLRAFTVEDMDGDFRTKQRLVLRVRRGGGYWIWKPYFIHRVMESEMADGDILVYADGGCHMNPEGRERLLQYFSMLDADPVQCGSVAFQMRLKEVAFTKREVLEHFNVSVATEEERARPDTAAVLDTGQYVGGIQILKKTPLSMDLVQRWFHEVDDHLFLITDSVNATTQLPGYVTHRHEQSVISVLRKVLGPHRTISLPDETYFKHLGRGTAGWDTHRHFPIHARRSKQ